VPPVRFTRNGCQGSGPGSLPRLPPRVTGSSVWKGMDDYISKPIQIANLCPEPVSSRAWGLGSKGSFVSLLPNLPLLPSAPIDAKTLQSLRQMAGARATEVLAQLIDNYLAERRNCCKRCVPRWRQRCSSATPSCSHAEVGECQRGCHLCHLRVRLWKPGGAGTYLKAAECVEAVHYRKWVKAALQ